MENTSQTKESYLLEKKRELQNEEKQKEIREQKIIQNRQSHVEEKSLPKTIEFSLLHFEEAKEMYAEFLNTLEKYLIQKEQEVLLKFRAHLKLFQKKLPILSIETNTWIHFLHTFHNMLHSLVLQILTEELKESSIVLTRLKSIKSIFELPQSSFQSSNYPLILHYFLYFLTYPSSEIFPDDYKYYLELIDNEIKSETIILDEKLKEIIENMALSRASIEVYHQINNCHKKISVDLKGTKEHVKHILKFLFEGKMFWVDRVNDNDDAETIFNGISYINRSYMMKKEAFFQWDLAKFSFVFLHEVAHIKRIFFASEFNFFKHSPESIKNEAGEFYEEHMFGIDKLMTIDQAKIYLDMDNWKFKGDLKKLLLVSYDNNKDQRLKKKKKGVRCATNRFTLDPILKKFYDSLTEDE